MSNCAPELDTAVALVDDLARVYVVAALGMVEILPSRIETVLEPVKPPGTPVLMPAGGPVVGVAAEIACE